MDQEQFYTRVNQLAESTDVRIDYECLDAFVAYLNSKAPSEWANGLPNWDNYLSASAKSGKYNEGYYVRQALMEFVLSTAQNAGYTDSSPDGTTRKWGIKGSGSKGWIQLYNAMMEDGVLNFISTPEEIATNIRPYFEGQKGPEELRGSPIPCIEERIAIYQELLRHKTEKVIKQVEISAHQPDGSYRFTYDNCVKPLAEAFPKAFGADPLLKKACLVPILLAANAKSHGVQVTADVPLPADYRVPQTYHNWGILEFSPQLVGQINSNTLLDQNDPKVLAVRAAAVQVGEILKARTGLPAEVLDAIPFVASSPEQQTPGNVVGGEKIAMGSHALRELPKADRPINSSGLFI